VQKFLTTEKITIVKILIKFTSVLTDYKLQHQFHVSDFCSLRYTVGNYPYLHISLSHRLKSSWTVSCLAAL